jgi:hypothetical protein
MQGGPFLIMLYGRRGPKQFSIPQLAPYRDFPGADLPQSDLQEQRLFWQRFEVR